MLHLYDISQVLKGLTASTKKRRGWAGHRSGDIMALEHSPMPASAYETPLSTDYACALQKDILLQGRLYLSENWLCFHSNIFRWETTDITFMTKEKTARLIPNAIQIATKGEKFFFTSFSARDRSYLSIFRLWQNVLLDKD
ncbi:hypothetical protein DV515_00010261 [Chloebia gouldiae]|uniref:GRAM domain-containing protein n=1 Tax=Chloebia gouldiae TaxID=44316 RepID=A0A3L8SAN1_CHLGU|nr:hypothetical protein DV515_00010261 [Chloebia gouldiae]